MIGAVVEGIRSGVVPCSLALLLPASAVVLAARHHPLVALGGFSGAAALLMWLRATGFLALSTIPLGTTLLGIVAVGAMAKFLASHAPNLLTTAGLALGPGAMAGWIWQPCVGPALGRILDRAASGSVLALPELTAYTLGVVLPAAAIALARIALGDSASPRRVVTVAGAVLGIGIGILVVTGIHQQVIGWLARSSV